MDEIDRKLIGILRRNARAGISDIALELKLSRATVRTRMEKLSDRGEILGYTVVLSSDAFELPVRGIMSIKIEGKGAERIVAQLGAMPEVSALHTTNGNWDLILELGTQTLLELDEVLNRIRKVDGITSSETNLLLSTKRSSRHISASRRGELSIGD
ncbi:Lrp/AsnC family transcriptional regulator [Flexibacterium corallicola]|uniref:Lrp/AsnC family transcriptional regulator n=1 Tax=Flexibacterium corallicola TaxID=3037259 RepID=UPI00286F9611|nr:Lrp/AsnC family transcriptional regulator [Pseudovibrio sp. M1P-2-3]